MNPDQLDLLVSVSRPAVHPDGWAVVATSRPDFAADTYVGQLWSVEEGRAPRRITRGFHDSAPQISPDGLLIAFLRAQAGEPPQLAVVPAGGGEPLVITDRKLGVKEFCFTPDSARIVFTAPVPDQGRYGTLDGVPAAAEDPRRITTLAFQMNGRGYLADQCVHVFVVDVPDPYGEPPVAPAGRAKKAQEDGGETALVPPARQLTDGDADDTQPVVAGEAVIVVSARHPGRDRDLRTDLYRIPLDGDPDGPTAEPEPVTRPAATAFDCSSPVVVGGDIYFLAADLGPSGRDFVGANSAVYRVPATGGEPERLTDPAGLGFESLAADPVTGEVVGVAGLRGAGVAMRIEPNGSTQLLKAPADASVQEVDARGGVVMASVATTVSPGEAARLGDDAALLTDFAAPLRAAAAPIDARELIATSPDGSPVHGWVLVPEGDGPHPVLLVIHGGPFAAFGPAFFDEAQVYAGAGYAVVMCNPRGAATYGEEFGRAIKGAFGDRDTVDVLAFLDHALATVPGLDSARVGVMGGSYGGYLTAWIIAHEHRFGGAIVERAYLDPRSFIGASDIGWYFAYEYNTDDPATMDAQSPLLLVDQVRTPTLIIHSEQDLRCPIAPALRYYAELKLHGVETELLVFPGENHELSRSGRPWHRKQRFEAILDWWSRHL